MGVVDVINPGMEMVNGRSIFSVCENNLATLPTRRRPAVLPVKKKLVAGPESTYLASSKRLLLVFGHGDGNCGGSSLSVVPRSCRLCWIQKNTSTRMTLEMCDSSNGNLTRRTIQIIRQFRCECQLLLYVCQQHI